MSNPAFADARRRADSFVERCRSALATKQGLAGLLGGSSGISPNVLGRQQTLSMAAEQYRHFTGWTHAIIRLIAQRIASQPVRVARPVGKQEVRRLQGMIQKGSGEPRWRKALASHRLEGIYQGRLVRDAMPPFVKNRYGATHRRELEILEDHPILRAFEEPNPLMVRWILLFVSICHLELTGRCYWWFTREDQIDFRRGSGPVQIWPLPTSWVEPVHERDRLFDHWVVTPPGGGSQVRVPSDQIAQLYYPDPANPLGCLSTLQAQSRAVVVDEAQLEAQRRAMANGLYMGMAVIVGRDPDVMGNMKGARPILTREQRAQVISAFKQSYRGPQNADEPVILDGLIEDVKPITTTPKEMAFLDSGKVSKERLSQGWGVNPVSMGQLEGANRASSRTADSHLVANAVNPRIELISEFFTRILPGVFSGEDAASRGATAEEIVYLEQAKTIDEDLERENFRLQVEQGAVTRNELRQFYGRPPIKGGDSCFVPSNTTFVPIEREETVLYDQGGPTNEVGTPGD